jgi:hypothetical protein
MKFNEIFSEFESGKPIRRKSWPLNRRISNKENLSLCNFDYSADDWEVWEEPPYDELLEEMKHYLYHELEFHKDRQSRYYPEENMDITDIWNVIDNYYLNKDVIRKLLRYIKDNNLVKKR